ncbi:acyltransferase ChoActase/COT/CPT [Martensiomyces pterosporus]|nr:acyltransferase ChoActase/COT/CPT [Martensiomyces pterosporus]
MSSQTPPHTMFFQGKLPRLPIPPLKETIDRYLESIVPVAGDDAAALAETHRRATHFLNVANRLQQRLISYDRAQPNSWLEKWWLELAYLSWREGLCINSNYWIALVGDPHAYGLASAPRALLPSNSDYRLGAIWDSKEYGEFQIRRAVKFIQRTLDFKELIDEGRLPIDRTRAGPLCMNQYRCIFGMTRIPRMGCDVLRQDRATANSRTVVIIAEDQLYSVDVIDGAGHRKPDGDLEAELFAIAADIVERRNTGDLDPAVTVLTAGHRDRWSAAYEKLERQPQNSATLNAVQKSLFAVSLDTTFSDPRGSINAHQVSLKCHGTQPGHNRWYDKCASFIFDRNGAAGYIGEHSPCDALIPCQMLEHITKDVAREQISQEIQSQSTPNYQTHVKRLRFTDVDASVIELISEAEKELAKAAGDSISKQIRFENYGSDWIKRAAKVSPDAFAQLALQLTYYKVHGTFASVYETASTRQYLHGRTETVRSLTSEAADFMRTMVDPASSSLDKYEALTRAAGKHQTLLRNSSSGSGVDRHIFGLRLAFLRLEALPGESPMTSDEKKAIEDFFSDPILAKSTTFQLSTSGLFPAYYLNHTGFGCVVPERAYGVNYIIEARRIKFGTEGKTKEAGSGTDVRLFEMVLRQCLLELKAICEQSNNIPVGDSSRL